MDSGSESSSWPLAPRIAAVRVVLEWVAELPRPFRRPSLLVLSLGLLVLDAVGR